MKSIVYELEAPRSLIQKMAELDEATLAPSAILAQTEFSAISTGTEIAAWLGAPPLRPSKVYPRLVGYCNLAKVVRTGSAVTNVSAGDFILTHQSHRSAFVCGANDVLLKVSDMGEAEHKKLTATYLYHLGYSALLAADYRPGHEVAVIGMGTLGIALATLLKAVGAEPHLFSDQDAAGFAPRGLPGVRPKAHAPAAAAALGDLAGVDIAVTTSSKWADYLLCLQLARKGGQVVCMGFPGRGEGPPPFNPLDSQYFYDKQLTIRHCGYVAELDLSPIDHRFTLKRNMRYLSGLILRGAVDPHDLLSIEAPWNELDRVYAQLASQQNGVYSALIDWRS
jgi:2-desacetyl-2-hydroxyethyl bacteriochlorophyllide A dehydrogenase